MGGGEGPRTVRYRTLCPRRLLDSRRVGRGRSASRDASGSGPRRPSITASTSFRGQRILVTGGSGTIGARLVDQLLGFEPEVVRVFGRDETKQFYQRQRLHDRRDVRFLVGDIRDRDRLVRAMDGIDTVFHCAALKHVESGEYNPFEATQTNVVGTQNVIDACLAAKVGAMILTSSDKAANPTSVMGASKLLAEKLVSAATNYRGSSPTRFASVRFGNVLGSRGSALELFFRQIAAGGPVTVTDPAMTRFVMTTDRAVELAIRAAEIACGGEVFVFKMPAARLGDLVEAAIGVVATANRLDPSAIATRTIEPRPGEKPYEELMTEDESVRARDIGEMFAVLPSIESQPGVIESYASAERAPVRAYRSDHVPAIPADQVRALVAETFAGDTAFR
jgi:UDP-N-acetylglucosamine 4,6-dehydratase